MLSNRRPMRFKHFVFVTVGGGWEKVAKDPKIAQQCGWPSVPPRSRRESPTNPYSMSNDLDVRWMDDAAAATMGS